MTAACTTLRKDLSRIPARAELHSLICVNELSRLLVDQSAVAAEARRAMIDFMGAVTAQAPRSTELEMA
jgi:hypothetical protein